MKTVVGLGESGKLFSLQYAWTLVNLTRCGCGDRVAIHGYMKRDLTLWATGILAAVLFIGSIGAFLLYVPALALAAVMTTLVGLLLMFVLGFQSGRGAIRISRARKALPSGLPRGVRTANESRAQFAVFPQAAGGNRCFQ